MINNDSSHWFTRDQIPFTEIVSAFNTTGVVAINLLTENACAELLNEAYHMSKWRDAKAYIGENDKRVWQRMEICDEFSPNSRYYALCSAFQTLFDQSLKAYELEHSPVFDTPIVFNDWMLQRYSPGKTGITPHRDHISYRHIVCLFILRGKGKFYISDNRQNDNAKEIKNTAGDVLFMRANGFTGKAGRPYHSVSEIISPRYVFGLRHKC